MRRPERRNRNIGTARSGRGRNNRMTIPQRHDDLSLYWERLGNHVTLELAVNWHPVTFLVEEPAPGYRHHCSVRDVIRVLGLVPHEHLRHLALIVFRQPTAKQRTLASVWGRLGYWSIIGRHSGPGIYLESQPTDCVLDWPRSLTPDARAELHRLMGDGFAVEEHARGFRLRGDARAVRACQLFRTVPHELGHYADYLECRERFGAAADPEHFWEQYDAKPSREKEVYAHGYADRFYDTFKRLRQLPFEPQLDADLSVTRAVPGEWFAFRGTDD